MAEAVAGWISAAGGYVEGMDPSKWPQLDGCPALRRLVAKQLDMQFADLRALMRLPVPEIDKHTQ